MKNIIVILVSILLVGGIVYAGVEVQESFGCDRKLAQIDNQIAEKEAEIEKIDQILLLPDGCYPTIINVKNEEQWPYVSHCIDSTSFEIYQVELRNDIIELIQGKNSCL